MALKSQLHVGLKFSLSAAAAAFILSPGRGRGPSHQHKFVEREEIGSFHKGRSQDFVILRPPLCPPSLY